MKPGLFIMVECASVNKFPRQQDSEISLANPKGKKGYSQTSES